MRIFDIGANLGNYTDALVKKYPDAEIICVEANPALVNHLLYRFKNFSNIKVCGYAVSDKSGETINFYINNTAHTISTASKNWVDNSRFSEMIWDQTIQAQTLTIEDLVCNFGVPDIIKIDVEGYETTVINGMENSYGVLSFEWAEEELDGIHKSCEKLLDLGYTKFSYRYADSPYEELPEMFYSYEEFSKLFYTQLDTKRKEFWGMIFAKK